MELNSSIRYTITGIINDIINTYGVFSKGAVSSYLYKDNNQGMQYRNNEVYSIFAGASKMCIIFESLMDWVIKIPLMYDCSKKEENIRKQWFVKDIRNGYFGTYLDYSFDLCKVEVNNYKAAIEAGINKVFAEEKKIMTYHGIPIYAQARIDSNFMNSDRSDDKPDDDFYDELDEALNTIETSSAIDDLYELTPFMEDLYNYVGKSKFLNVMSFLVDNDINDLHNENVGYDFNGHPIFFDYSGFHRC